MIIASFARATSLAGARWAYNMGEMAATIVRRIMFGGLAAWVFIYAWEQYHLGGHTGTAIALGLGGLVLVALAINSKGGG